jgi:hypothetical protein
MTLQPTGCWVITHGEPLGPHLLQCVDGRLQLVDWDSLLIASRMPQIIQLTSNESPTGRSPTSWLRVPATRVI